MGRWTQLDMMLMYGHWKLDRLEFEKAKLDAKHKR